MMQAQAGWSRTMMIVVGVAGGLLVVAALVYAFVFMA
jgi:hypothetical protein